MKKTVFGVLAAFVVIAMTSCGGGKTPEQIEAEAVKKFDAQKSELEATATQACDASRAGVITAALDSMTQAHNAANPQAPIAAPVQ
jgi:hypothetical protein